jgi:murein DD-endopeptidase MepM/ murein hydrolase activator NlpD
MRKTRRGRKAFWHNIKFKYKLTIINENTLEEVVGIHVSKLNGLSVLLSACTVIFLIAAAIIAFTPLRNYLPGYMNSEVRSQIVANALRADSLQAALERQSRYVMNIQDILSGQVKADTVQSIDSLTNLRAEKLMERSKKEEEFRKQYEEKERYNLTAVTDVRDAAGLIFYRPLRGVMSAGFNPEKRHFGIDLTASPNESILATLDGTVIMAAYTAEWGYVIQIQHPQNFISVYKHCGSLMKREGEQVKGGEVIALVGKSTEDGNQPHLHFELWHKGNPTNPEKYVVF